MTKSTSPVALQVGVHEAKTRLSELLRYVESGHEVEIHRGGTPVARLVPAPAESPRIFGSEAGRIVIADDFDAPLNDDELALFGIE